MEKIEVLKKEISFYREKEEDYVCITDIAKYKDERTDDIIKNWRRKRNTIEFLGVWEHLNNPDFNPVKFDGFRKNYFKKRLRLFHQNSPVGRIIFCAKLSFELI